MILDDVIRVFPLWLVKTYRNTLHTAPGGVYFE